VAADLALHLTPADVIRDIREDLYPWKDLILSSVHELAEWTNATFVEIGTKNERILVKKNGTDLIVTMISNVTFWFFWSFFRNAPVVANDLHSAS
jgi:hypothetical protein